MWNLHVALHLSTHISLHLAPSSQEEATKLCQNELQLLEKCLHVNPKSYCVWLHRHWVMTQAPSPDWGMERKLCSLFLKFDERNCKFETSLVPMLFITTWVREASFEPGKGGRENWESEWVITCSLPCSEHFNLTSTIARYNFKYCTGPTVWSWFHCSIHWLHFWLASFSSLAQFFIAIHAPSDRKVGGA